MVKIRLKRVGAKKAPFYHIVVADSKSPRDGKIIEQIGTYNPMTDPSEVNFDKEEVENQPTFKQGKMVFICKKIYSDWIKPEHFIDDSLDERWYPQKDYHEMYVGEIVAAYKQK